MQFSLFSFVDICQYLQVIYDKTRHCRRYERKKLQEVLTVNPRLQFVAPRLCLIHVHNNSFASVPVCQAALDISLQKSHWMSF